ncbi:MAG: hypothetical protein ACKVVP_08310 [Chloroflexota bacterium]
MTSVVSERGQITIDRQARKMLGVEAGMVAIQVVVDDHLEISFVPQKHNRSAFGVLGTPAGPIPSWDELEQEAAALIASDAIECR